MPAILKSNGKGVILNAANMKTGPFAVTTQENFGTDKRTRLMLFASNVSSLVNTSHSSNFILTSSGALANMAASVMVEARTSDGRTFLLPVEFAGAQGAVTGLDQINIVLIPELQGIGDVELTLIVTGLRSNSVALTIR